MNKNSLILMVLLMILALSACTNMNEKAICKFELHQNHISISEFIKIEPAIAFLAKDSANILNMEYESALNDKLNELNQTKEERLNAKNQAQTSLSSTDNENMIKIINNRIQIIDSEIEFTNQLIETYKHKPDLTFLKGIQETIDKYNSNPELILGFTQEVYFIGMQGLLPQQEFHRKYLWDKTKLNIVGICD